MSQQGKTYSEIEALDPEWLWDGLLIAGDVNLLIGDAGVGKGYFIADLVARVTRGLAMPDGIVTGLPGSVVMITPEDKAMFTTIHRLTAAGADLAKVVDLTDVRRGSGHSSFTVPDDLGLLRQAIIKSGDCRLVVLDPLMGVSAVNIGSNLVVRNRIMRPLQALADDTGVCIILVHHTVKSGAIGGSKGLVDAARVVNFIRLNTDNDEIRELTTHKNNLARGDSAPARYVIEGDRPDTKVRYLVPDDESEAPPEPGREPRPGTGQALLLNLLRAARGPVTGQALSSQSQMPYHTVRVLMHRLAKAGLVDSPERGSFQAVTIAQTDEVTRPFSAVSL